MIYDLSNKVSADRYERRSKQLLSKGYLVELKQIKPLRTSEQNRYLHLILGWFAIEYGETLEYVKQEFFKKQVNAEIFKTEHTNKKTGEVRLDWKSTAQLNTKELTEAIDRFRTWSSKTAGIYLPSANEESYLKQIIVEMDLQKEYI